MFLLSRFQPQKKPLSIILEESMSSYNYDDYKEQSRNDLIHMIEALKKKANESVKESITWRMKHENTVYHLHEREATIRYLRAVQRDYDKRIDCLDLTIYRKVMRWMRKLKFVASSLIQYAWRG